MSTTGNQPIACTLQGRSYQERLAWIAELSRAGLRQHEQRDLVLELRYAPQVAEQVREMVRQEQECCAFLNFALDERCAEIRLTITAPEAARGVADLLFQPFVQVDATGTTTRPVGC